MALAAALAATGARPASFLPTITCSSCAQEIEIAAMGEHICAPEMAEPAVHKSRTSSMGNPYKLREYGVSERDGASLAQVQNAGMGANQRATLKQSRIVLPKINSDAANCAFLSPREQGLDLPLTPAASAHSGSSGGTSPHSMTRPFPRLYDQRPPSPELTSNLGCAFPPFPTQATASGRSTPSNGRGTSTGSDRAPSRAAFRPQNLNPAPSFVEPKSPGLESQRFEILSTGPLTARRQGSGDSNEDMDLRDQRPPSRASAEERLTPSHTWEGKGALQRLDSSAAGQYATEALKTTPPARPARLSYEQLSPVLLERFSAEPDFLFTTQSGPAHAVDRKDTYSMSEQDSQGHIRSQDLSEMRSNPATRHPERKASLANNDVSHFHTTPELCTSLPKRSSSRVGARIDYRIENAPPVPRPVQQHQNHSKHTPSDSASSSVSSAATYSSGPSPISSAASSVDPFSPLSSALGAEDELMQSRGVSARNQQKPGLRAELPSNRSPPRKFGRPAPLVEDSSKVGRMHVIPMGSPMNPAMRLGARQETRQAPTPATARNGPLAVQSAALGGTVELVNSPTTNPPNTYDASPEEGARPRPDLSDVSAPRRPSRPTTAKPMCRGCGLVIEGKSVKAADGRLTGRWHKSCFVCSSCVKPFATADFYVIGDLPYCEHHYHERNGSLCHGCHRGIEGQYLETTSTTRFGTTEKKLHPRCFTCATCHEVLSEDYFEISGVGALCERHALAILRQQQIRNGSRPYGPGRRDIIAERRTTRLINPMMA